MFDLTIIGGGLVGLATAYKLLLAHPDLKVCVLEKEARVGLHQSSRNSGVIHTGVYYKPGSFKARLCVKGREELLQFAERHAVSYEICGKVIVATNEAERVRLEILFKRSQENGVRTQRLSQEALHEIEPHVRGIDALLVPGAGVVDFPALARSFVVQIEESGGEVRTDFEVKSALRSTGRWILSGVSGVVESRYVINCAGLFSDRMVRAFGGVSPLSIVPFRGEYYVLRSEAASLCRTLIYPVPDPKFPFLGVHFTRRIDGSVECGPNAVLALKREGYRWSDISLADTVGMVTYSGFRSLIAKHWKMGLGEMHRSLSKGAFVRALQALVPDVREDHLEPGGSGVRAQAVRPDGTLEDDFAFHETDGALHVLNAPSPAATSCLAIGGVITERLLPLLEGMRAEVFAAGADPVTAAS